jgi:Ni/Co efflux regulator RcnB
MKKLVLLLAVVFIAATTFGQAKTDATKTTQKKDVKTEKAKPTQTPAPAPAAATAAPVKKDGTPDKRFKANKEAPKPAGPLKKDGTPDKRFKANKDATPPTKK